MGNLYCIPKPLSPTHGATTARSHSGIVPLTLYLIYSFGFVFGGSESLSGKTPTSVTYLLELVGIPYLPTSTIPLLPIVTISSVPGIAPQLSG